MPEVIDNCDLRLICDIMVTFITKQLEKQSFEEVPEKKEHPAEQIIFSLTECNNSFISGKSHEPTKDICRTRQCFPCTCSIRNKDELKPKHGFCFFQTHIAPPHKKKFCHIKNTSHLLQPKINHQVLRPIAIKPCSVANLEVNRTFQIDGEHVFSTSDCNKNFKSSSKARDNNAKPTDFSDDHKCDFCFSATHLDASEFSSDESSDMSNSSSPFSFGSCMQASASPFQDVQECRVPQKRRRPGDNRPMLDFYKMKETAYENVIDDLHLAFKSEKTPVTSALLPARPDRADAVFSTCNVDLNLKNIPDLDIELIEND